jgi:hypothetical protein
MYYGSEEIFLSDLGEAKSIVMLQEEIAKSKLGFYAGDVKGNVGHLSPEANYKYNLGHKGTAYQNDLFKNDVYGNGILSIE